MRASATAQPTGDRQALTRAAVQASSSTSSAGGIPAVGKAIFIAAVLLLLLAMAPARLAYAVGPRAGEVLSNGRLPLAGIGIAMAVGMLVAFGLGGTP